MQINIDDLRDERVRDLLALHMRGMEASSPPGAVFGLDLPGLTAPGITVWTAWENDILLGIGALKMIDRSSAEIKSTRTHPDHLRTAVAARLLDHIIGEARNLGIRRLPWRRAAGASFEPALGLYQKFGFLTGWRSVNM